MRAVNTVTQIVVVLGGCFVAYLVLLGVVVLRTGSTDGLAAVGAAVHAFIAAIIALIKRWPATTTSDAQPGPPGPAEGGQPVGANDAP